MLGSNIFTVHLSCFTDTKSKGLFFINMMDTAVTIYTFCFFLQSRMHQVTSHHLACYAAHNILLLFLNYFCILLWIFRVAPLVVSSAVEWLHHLHDNGARPSEDKMTDRPIVHLQNIQSVYTHYKLTYLNTHTHTHIRFGFSFTC